MNEQINIIGKLDSNTYRSKTLRIKEASIPVEKLRTELDGLISSLSATLLNTGKIGDFLLNEVTFHVEISASGKVSLLGTGAAMEASGAVELKFVRPT